MPRQISELPGWQGSIVTCKNPFSNALHFLHRATYLDLYNEPVIPGFCTSFANMNKILPTWT